MGRFWSKYSVTFLGFRFRPEGVLFSKAVSAYFTIIIAKPRRLFYRPSYRVLVSTSEKYRLGKNVFACKLGRLFNWTRIPFDFCNSSPTFQRIMTTILKTSCKNLVASSWTSLHRISHLRRVGIYWPGANSTFVSSNDSRAALDKVYWNEKVWLNIWLHGYRIYGYRKIFFHKHNTKIIIYFWHDGIK